VVQKHVGNAVWCHFGGTSWDVWTGQSQLSSYMKNSESIGFTPKNLKICFAQIMFFTDKKS
jgi:hypothetical protein